MKLTLLKDLAVREPRSVRFLSSHGYVVIARRVSNKEERKIPMRSLLVNNSNFFRVRSDYEYYVGEDAVQAVYEHFMPDVADISQKKSPEGSGSESALPNFGEDYSKVEGLSEEKRVQLVREQARRLEEVTKKTSAKEASQVLVDTAVQTMMANRAMLEQALRMSNAEAQRYTKEMAEATEEMVRGTELVLRNDFYETDLIAQLVKRSTGTVVQHMTRVYLMGFAFLLYYNTEFLQTSLANTIRIQFPQRYRAFYKRLLPHLDENELTLERVFWDGMRALTFPEIRKIAMGFLLHDVGKTDDIEYHEGEKGYDREVIVRHVKIGYKAVIEKSAYPREAALITGYHHEYYGHPAGYGYFREFLAEYKHMNPAAKIDFLMSYEMEPLIDYQVLAYFPAKMLEVVDVFDSLTDPHRLYRKALSPQEAIDLMYSEFIEKNSKLDPIIMDLFHRFLTERGSL